jgi:hypothetical protein
MAEKPLTTTRRTLLGAAAFLPIAALATPTPVRPERSQDEVDRRSTAPLSPSDRAALAWNRRLARYRRLAERTREAGETGFFRTANDRYNRERAEVEARYGSWEAAAATREGRKLRRAIFARVAAAEEAFYDRCTRPMQRAAALLALTGAPDLPALLNKLLVMQEQQLDELEILGRSVVEVLEGDVRELSGGCCPVTANRQ